MQKSFTRKYLIYSLLFGIGMGLVFPLYALMFVTFISPTHQILFNTGCVIAGITVGGASFIIGKSTILKNIKSLSGQMQSLINGNAAEIDSKQLESEDEIGEIARNFANFNQGMTEAMEQVEEISNEYKMLSEELSANARELSADYHSAVKTIKDLTVAITVLDAKTSENQKNTTDAVKVIHETDSLSNQAREKIVETASAFDNIQKIVNTISEIVHKTELLSINAAIESANAGEYGKGFSVVAKEIQRQSEIMNSFADKISSVSEQNRNKSEHARDYSIKNTQKHELAVKIIDALQLNFTEQNKISSEISEALNENSSKFESLHLVSKKMDSIAQSIDHLNHQFETVLQFSR